MRRISRREFLKFCSYFGLAAVLPVDLSGSKREGFIRPPGSVEEPVFNNLCYRCGLCFKICPAKCLKPVSFTDSVKSWGSPHIIPREAGCLRCGSCSRVCPSGALQSVPPEIVKMGTARIEKERCLVWTREKECLVCLEYCPVGAVILDEKGRPEVDPGVCVGCGLCEQNCPVPGKKAAIRVTALGEKRYYLKEKKYR